MSALRSGLVLLAATGIGAALFWAATAPLQQRLAEARSERAALAAEAARLEGQIAESVGMGQEGTLPATLVLEGQTRAEASLRLQERLTDLAGEHAVVLTSFAAGIAPEDLTHPAAAVVIEGEGTEADVVRFLAALEAVQPPMGLGQVMLRRQDAEKISLRVQAWGFVAEGAG
jgi:hypothetical protein